MCASLIAMKPQQLLTAHDVALILGVSRHAVYRRRKSGALPTVAKVPGATGAYLFDRTVIESIAAKENDNA